MLARVAEDRPANRFNDCKCDPQGRLWAGTMSKKRSPGTASLYRVEDGMWRAPCSRWSRA